MYIPASIRRTGTDQTIDQQHKDSFWKRSLIKNAKLLLTRLIYHHSDDSNKIDDPRGSHKLTRIVQRDDNLPPTYETACTRSTSITNQPTPGSSQPSAFLTNKTRNKKISKTRPPEAGTEILFSNLSDVPIQRTSDQEVRASVGSNSRRRRPNNSNSSASRRTSLSLSNSVRSPRSNHSSNHRRPSSCTTYNLHRKSSSLLVDGVHSCTLENYHHHHRRRRNGRLSKRELTIAKKSLPVLT